jgi:heterotetrameric sarcosine oxidase gamma subunit
MPDYALTARAPFTDLPIVSASQSGVVVVDRDGRGLAAVHARRGQIGALTERIRERFGIELPRGPQRRAAGDVAFVGTAPRAWLATSEASGESFALTLKEAIGAVASITDQSSGYALLRLTGPKLRDTLAKLVPIDLHERAFAPGDVASTVASHVGITLWRLQDGGDGSPVFDIVMFRSLTGSFWYALASSAAEFGLVVTATLGDRSGST